MNKSESLGLETQGPFTEEVQQSILGLFDLVIVHGGCVFCTLLPGAWLPEAQLPSQWGQVNLLCHVCFRIPIELSGLQNWLLSPT